MYVGKCVRMMMMIDDDYSSDERQHADVDNDNDINKKTRWW